MRRKRKEQAATPGFGGVRITPIDVQQVEFRLAFRGYNERDVDAFLDRVTEDLSHYLEENQRLRTGQVSVAPPEVEVEAARREAEEIRSRAREEAAEIVRTAEREAAATRATASAVSGDARTAVAPFLNREREFLQSLGSIVQTHAEEIRSMVLALRERAEREPAAEPAAQPAATDAVQPAAASVEEPAAASVGEESAPAMDGASASEIRERLGGPEEPASTEDVVVDATEPVFSPEGAQTGEERERSLRELFWGDE